jgi:hypothetical protein
MPSIYDTILREDPLEAARREAQARLKATQLQQRSQFLQSLQGLDPGARQGAIAGEAAGQLFGGAISKVFGMREAPDAVETSPEVAQARANADLVKSLQGLEADPASAAWATQAAAQAKAAGREDLAFQLLGEAAQRRKAEAKLAQETADKENADWRATINTLPAAQKFSLIVNDPAVAETRFGLKGKAAEAFVKDARDSLETIRLKNAGELKKIKPITPGNVDKGDLADVDSVLNVRGYDADAFDRNVVGDGSEQRDAFSRAIAGHAQEYRRAFAAANPGRSVPMTKVVEDALNDLEDQGFFTISEKNVFGFGGGIDLAEDFDGNAINNALQRRIDELQGTKPAPSAPALGAEAAPSGPDVPFVDFTQPSR